MRWVPLSDRLDLCPAAVAHVRRCWPSYIWQATPLDAGVPDFFDVFRRFPDTQLLALEGDRIQVVVNSVPLRLPEQLPDSGWTWALSNASYEAPNGLSALAVSVAPEQRGRRLSRQALVVLKAHTARLGLQRLVVPVRPNHKHLHPKLPMQRYIERRDADDRMADPWLRQHLRLGACVHGVCERSMALTGTLAEWRAWTGANLDRDGGHLVPQLLVPLQVDLASDRAVYVEPNVWVEHPLAV